MTERRPGALASQRGFTLIELMVALLVSSLLVGMILAIYSRMSLAYREQQQIAGVQQVLAAARAAIELDAKQAGLGIAPGFYAAPTGGVPQSPVRVINNNNGFGPDGIALFYADTSAQALVQAIDPVAGAFRLTVDNVVGFAGGDLIVLSSADTSNSLGNGEANITRYSACVLRIDAAANSVVAGLPATIRISNVAPWGGIGHCNSLPAPPLAAPFAPPWANMMVYKFVAHAYRINTTDAVVTALGALQQSANGGLLGINDQWDNLAFGFSDIQTAVRIYHDAFVPPADLDGDGDGLRDWYSDGVQDTLTTLVAGAPPTPPTPPAPTGSLLMQMSITLVAHTDRNVEGVATSQLPPFSTGNLANNAFGDRAAVAPATPPPAWPDPMSLYPGQRIYRYTTFQVDFRNLGIGR